MAVLIGLWCDADQITLPNGKYVYVERNSTHSTYANQKGWVVKTVSVFGANKATDIHNLAQKGVSMIIHSIKSENILNLIATPMEVQEAFSKLI